MNDFVEIEKMCAEQEERFQFSSFSRADALSLGLLLAEKAKKYEQGVAMRIVINGLTVFQYMPEGAEINNDIWMGRKVRTVTQFGFSSLRVMAMLQGDPAEQKLDPMQYALGGGGFPLKLRGSGMIGVITVSGLTHLEDHQLIIDALTDWFSN